MACTFSTSELPKSGRSMVFFCHFDFEPRFGPQRRAIFTSHLPIWLHARRFSEPTFRPSGATKNQKNRVSRLVYLFAHLIIFLLPFSSLSLPTSAFPSVHFVGSLTSKLPSVMWFAHAQAWTDALLPVAKNLCRDTCLSVF